MSRASGAQERKPARVALRQQVLLAALECSGGDLQRTFTAEDLLFRPGSATRWRGGFGARNRAS